MENLGAVELETHVGDGRKIEQCPTSGGAPSRRHRGRWIRGVSLRPQVEWNAGRRPASRPQRLPSLHAPVVPGCHGALESERYRLSAAHYLSSFAQRSSPSGNGGERRPSTAYRAPFHGSGG